VEAFQEPDRRCGIPGLKTPRSAGRWARPAVSPVRCYFAERALPDIVANCPPAVVRLTRPAE